MKFQVIGPDGKNRMTMHEVSCLPTKDEVKSMLSNGFKFKLDGKVLSKSATVEFVSSNKSTPKTTTRKSKKTVSADVPADRLF